MRGSAEERFFAKVRKTPICWLWTAGRTANGHGIFGANGTSVCAHRWSYEYHVGPIPEGLDLDHLCRVPSCVNPDHLEPVTRDENSRRAWRAKALIERRLEVIDLNWPGFIEEFRGRSRGRGTRGAA